MSSSAREVWKVPFLLGDRNVSVPEAEPAAVDAAAGPKGVPVQARPPVQTSDVTTFVPATRIDSVVDALSDAHKYAVAQAATYWRCEMMVSQTRMEANRVRAEAAELRQLLKSEPREAEDELQQAFSFQEEAAMIASEAEAQKALLAESDAEVSDRSSTAHDVASFYTRMQQDIDEAKDVARKRTMMVQDDHFLAVQKHFVATLEAEKLKPMLETLPHIEAEVKMLRSMLMQEETDCDEALLHGARLRKEIQDLRTQDPASNDARAEHDRLLREVRALSHAQLSGALGEDSARHAALHFAQSVGVLI